MCKPSSTHASGSFNVTSSTAGLINVTPWVLCAGTDALRIIRSIQGSSGSPTTDVLYQFASVKTSEPDAWTAGSSTQTGDGYKTDNIDVSATTNKLWVRAGLNASAATQAQGEASLTLLTDTQSRIIASTTIVMRPTVGTTYTTIPLSAPLPIVGMQSVVFAVIYTHEGGTTYAIPAYRKIANDLDAGSSWSTLASPSWTADTLYNSGDLTLADDTTQGFWQPALKFKNTTSGGVLKVIVAAKW